MNETILKIVQQNEYDRYVFLTYLNNQIIGLNFWQGIGEESYKSVMDHKGYEPCVHLTEIFNRLKINYEEISDFERIDKAIELYTNSFIFQKESLYIPEKQTNIIKEALKFYYDQFKRFNEVPTDNENYKMFDLLTLEALMNYDIKVEMSEYQKSKFSFKNGIDFPIYNN